MDILAVGQLVGGLIPAIGGAVDPYFYTAQEQGRDALANTALQNQGAAIQAQSQAIAQREETTRQAITYGLAGVLGVSLLYLGSKLVSE